MKDADALARIEGRLKTVARRVLATAEVLDLCRFMDEAEATIDAWAAVLDRQADELARVAAIMRQDS